MTEYKWYRMNFTDAPAMELTSAEQTVLLDVIREAGTRDMYRVEIPVTKRIEDFIQVMLWNQDSFRIKALLRAAFGCGEGDEFKEHNLCQIQPPYRLLVYNLGKKKPGEPDY